MKLRDEVEGVVAAKGGEVEVLREDEGDQDGDRCDHLFSRQSGGFFCVLRGFVLQMGEASLVPAADSNEHEDAQEGGEGKPCGTDLSVGKDDEYCEERPDCRAGVASDLEERLREAVLSAGGHSGYAGRLGVEDCRAHADQCG